MVGTLADHGFPALLFDCLPPSMYRHPHVRRIVARTSWDTGRTGLWVGETSGHPRTGVGPDFQSEAGSGSDRVSRDLYDILLPSGKVLVTLSITI